MNSETKRQFRTSADSFVECNPQLIESGTIETILDAYFQYLLDNDILMYDRGRERF